MRMVRRLILVLAVVSSVGMGGIEEGEMDDAGRLEERKLDDENEEDEEGVLIVDEAGVKDDRTPVEESDVKTRKVEVGALGMLEGAAWDGMQHIPPGRMVF